MYLVEFYLLDGFDYIVVVLYLHHAYIFNSLMLSPFSLATSRHQHNPYVFFPQHEVELSQAQVYPHHLLQQNLLL